MQVLLETAVCMCQLGREVFKTNPSPFLLELVPLAVWKVHSYFNIEHGSKRIREKELAEAGLQGTTQASFSLLSSRDKTEVKIKEWEGSKPEMEDVRRISLTVAMDIKANNRVSYNLSGNSRWNFLLRSKLRAFYLRKKNL